MSTSFYHRHFTFFIVLFSVLPMAVHAIDSFIDWKGSAQILRSPTMPYMDVIRSPLLEAYSRYFTGTFWVRGASVRPKELFARILGPGEGLYDALQLCRRKIVPREFCQLLLDDVVQGLEYAQLGIFFGSLSL